MTRVIDVTAIDVEAIVPIVVVDIATGQGPPGPPGPPGPAGLAGNMPMDYSINATTTPPPSSGQLRFNSTDQTAATTLYIDKMTAPGNDASVLLRAIEPGQELYVQDKDNADRYQLYKVVSGGPTLNLLMSDTHFEIPVEWTSGGQPVPTGQRAFVQIRSATPSGEPGPEGPQGPQGEPGPQGPTGEKGEQGPIGPQGIEGPMGPQGVQGSQGAAGTGITMRGSVPTQADLPASASQGDAYIVQADDSLWIHDGMQFVSGGSIAGPPGAQGPQGPQGNAGPAGADSTVPGPQGPAGAASTVPGPQGPKGDTGAQGATGTAGATGPQGPRGDVGPAGSQGLQGPQGPQGNVGAQGPAGPSAVSADAGNLAKLGTDSLILVSNASVLKGVTDASNAAAGMVGEVLSTSITTAQNVSATAANVGSLVLTAGDWVVGGNVNFVSPGTAGTRYAVAISSTSATLPTAAQLAAGTGTLFDLSLTFGKAAQNMNTSLCRINVAASTTVYLVALGPTTTATGYISARRVR